MPSLIDSGVSPFHQMGAGSDTSTVNCLALAGLVIGIDPFSPETSQLPIILAAAAGTENRASAASAAAARKLLLSNFIIFLRLIDLFQLDHARRSWARSPGPAETGGDAVHGHEERRQRFVLVASGAGILQKIDLPAIGLVDHRAYPIEAAAEAGKPRT